VALRVIKRLLDAGVSLQRVRKAVDYLQDLDEPASGVTLFSDGTGVYQAHSPEAVIDLLNRGQGVFAIAVDKVWTDLEGSLERLRAKKVRRGGRAAAGGA
jgi:DNA-binding transcriptional MerR regulator